jgi:4-amino-4-deoxy-L-arabinose transferase-like glycosyltransferase
METSAFLALTLATALAHHRGHAVLAGLLLGVSILTRPDAGLMALLLAGDHLWRERRFPWKLALVSTSVVLPWLLYSQMTFGSLLPVTFGAKTLQSQLGYWAEQPSFLVSALKHHGWYWWCFAAAASGIVCKRERFLTLPKLVRLFITFPSCMPQPSVPQRRPPFFRQLR